MTGDDRRTDDKTRERWDEIEATYAKKYATVVKAVEKTGRKISAVIWGLILLVFVSGAIVFYLIDRNSQAIKVSCTLLANVATQAGAAGAEGGDLSPATKAQAKITALAFDVIVRSMTPAELERFGKLNAERKAAGGFVTLPKCSQVAEDPESVKQLGTQTAQPKP